MGSWLLLFSLALHVGCFGFLILKLRWYVLLLLFAAVLPVVLVKTSLLPDTRLCLGFYAGTLLELNYMTKNKGGNLGNAADVSAFIAGAFGILLVSVFGGVFLQSLVPKNEYQDSQLVANAKEEALGGLSRLRYKGQGANSLPDGKLKQTGAGVRHRIRHLKLPWSIRLLCICVALWEAFMTALPGRRFPRKRPMKKKTCITGFTRRAFMEKPSF